MRISLIVALSENYVIGKNNSLPWRLPDDLKRFKSLTTGHPIILGRKTYESIGRVLPNRENLIISRQPGYQVAGANVFQSLREALEFCQHRNVGEVFVIGGGEIYSQALPFADRLYLTWVHVAIQGDTFFPRWKESDFRETSREDHLESEIPFSWVTLDRMDGKSEVDSSTASPLRTD